jgi:hypothetical protein
MSRLGNRTRMAADDVCHEPFRAGSMKATTRLLLILLLCIGAAAEALACKCAWDPDAPPEGSPAAVAADLESSDAVFTATVLGRQSWARLLLRVPRYLFLSRGERELTDEQEDRMFRRKVWLRVEEAFKGAEPGRTVLFTGWGVGDCGYRFRRGDRYLVYASESEGELWTGICHSTKPLEEAGSELSILRRLTSSRSAATK